MCGCHWHQEGSILPISKPQGLCFKTHGLLPLCKKSVSPQTHHADVKPSLVPCFLYYQLSPEALAIGTALFYVVFKSYFSREKALLCLQCHGTFTWQRLTELEVLFQSPLGPSASLTSVSPDPFSHLSRSICTETVFIPHNEWEGSDRSCIAWRFSVSHNTEYFLKRACE